MPIKLPTKNYKDQNCGFKCQCLEALEAKTKNYPSSVTAVLESLSVPCVVVSMQVSWCGKEKYLLDLCLFPPLEKLPSMNVSCVVSVSLFYALFLY